MGPKVKKEVTRTTGWGFFFGVYTLLVKLPMKGVGVGPPPLALQGMCSLCLFACLSSEVLASNWLDFYTKISPLLWKRRVFLGLFFFCFLLFFSFVLLFLSEFCAFYSLVSRCKVPVCLLVGSEVLRRGGARVTHVLSLQQSRGWLACESEKCCLSASGKCCH